MDMRPNYYSNFKMGKLEGGYMLNYKQYYKNPLDHHFAEKSVSPSEFSMENKFKQKTVSVPRFPRFENGLDSNFMLTDEESKAATAHQRSPSRLLAQRIEGERRKLRKPELLCDKSKTINLIKE